MESACGHNRPRLVLASASPRRRQLLRDAGYVFDVIASHVAEPEADRVQVSPACYAEALALLKARYVAEGMTNALVLGADTVVAAGGDIYGKPANEADARRILTCLLHTPHEVITGVALLDTSTGRRLIAHDVTRVTMTPMTPAQLDAYLASGLWEGKAGAYGIQDHDDQFVRKLEGSFSNVVGLPMALVQRMLAEWVVAPDNDGTLCENPSHG